MKLRVRYLAAAAVTALAAVALPGTASAAGIPWQTYRTTPWTDAPGAVCAFGVTTAIVKDQEQYRNLRTYPNGDPKLQEYRGPLIVRYTNTSTGKSAVADLSGYGWFHYLPDGALDIGIPSHFDATVKVGNVGQPPGEWILTGRSEVTVTASGAIGIRLSRHATERNMCDELS
jgi:hypothetical protein